MLSWPVAHQTKVSHLNRVFTNEYLIFLIQSITSTKNIVFPNEWQDIWWCRLLADYCRLLAAGCQCQLPPAFVFTSYTSGWVDFHCGASTSDVTLQLWQTVLLFPLPPQRAALSPHSSPNFSWRHGSICVCLQHTTMFSSFPRRKRDKLCHQCTLFVLSPLRCY